MGPSRRVPPSRMVRRGWDAVSWIYRPARPVRDPFGHGPAQYRRWIRPLLRDLPGRARVLDLGCGCGVPASAILAKRFRVTGVDVSGTQIERARRRVPNASFVREDMTRVRFPPRSFRAVVCLYALIHVPLPAQRPLLRRVHRWLVPGGSLLLITGHEAFEGVEEDWLGSGSPMYWSHADAATYRMWLEAAGFTIDEQSFVPEGSSGHELFRARARSARTGARGGSGRGRRAKTNR